MNPPAIHHRKRGTRRQLRHLLGLLAAAAASGTMWVLAPAPEAAAHTGLTASNPAPDSRVPVPAEIQLTFTDAVEPRFTTVTLAVDDAPAATLTNQVSGATVTATPNRSTVNATERWKVAYRVVSRDGHPITGDLTFTVSGTAPTTAPVPAPPTPSGTPNTNPASPATSTSASAPSTPAPPSVQAGYPADTDRHPGKGQWGFIAIMSALLLVVPVMAGLFRFLPTDAPAYAPALDGDSTTPRETAGASGDQGGGEAADDPHASDAGVTAEGPAGGPGKVEDERRPR